MRKGQVHPRSWDAIGNFPILRLVFLIVGKFHPPFAPHHFVEPTPPLGEHLGRRDHLCRPAQSGDRGWQTLQLLGRELGKFFFDLLKAHGVTTTIGGAGARRGRDDDEGRGDVRGEVVEIEKLLRDERGDDGFAEADDIGEEKAAVSAQEVEALVYGVDLIREPQETLGEIGDGAGIELDG